MYIIITLSSSAYSCIHELMRGERKEGRKVVDDDDIYDHCYEYDVSVAYATLLTTQSVVRGKEGRMNIMRDKKE